MNRYHIEFDGIWWTPHVNGLAIGSSYGDVFSALNELRRQTGFDVPHQLRMTVTFDPIPEAPHE